MRLDIGCGGSKQFVPRKIRGDVNCDILKPTAKILNFVLCDAHFLPFKSNYFSKVFMFNLIEHLENPLKSLKEAIIVLKRKGILELATPNALYLPKIIRSIFRGTYTPHRTHMTTWAEPELANLMFQLPFKFSIRHDTCYYDQKPLHYRFLVKIRPFPTLKHKNLCVTLEKS